MLFNKIFLLAQIKSVRYEKDNYPYCNIDNNLIA